MIISRKKDAVTKYEYGCDLRRLYPWNGVDDPFWGSAIASVRPGESTTEHFHDESETFIILSGKGEIEIDNQVEEISSEDVIYIPKLARHQVRNLSPSEPLVFLTIFWDSPEARERMKQTLLANCT